MSCFDPDVLAMEDAMRDMEYEGLDTGGLANSPPVYYGAYLIKRGEELEKFGVLRAPALSLDSAYGSMYRLLSVQYPGDTVLIELDEVPVAAGSPNILPGPVY